MVSTIKINYDGDIRRKAIEEVTYDSVVKVVTDFFPEIGIDDLQMRYADEEGDMCTLAHLTFPDFVMTQRGNKVLKVQVSKKKSETVTPPSGSNLCATTYDTMPEGGTPNAEARNDSAHGGASFGHGGHSGGGKGGRKGGGKGGGKGVGKGGLLNVLKMVKALKDAGVLTPPVLASLFVQWLPLISQKITRKLDSINHAVKEGMNAAMQSALLVLQHHVGTVPALQVFESQFKAILEQALHAPLLGDTLRGLLITLQGLAFEVQVTFVEKLSEALLPILDDLVADSPESNEQPWLQDPMVHHGVVCDHCGVSPIAGPRFKCKTCPDYDLCGNCFPQKTTIHDTPGATPHDFQCMMCPHEHWGKGFGKGHPLHNFVAPFLHGVMDGRGMEWFKGCGKGGKGESTTEGHPQDGAAPPCNEHLWNLLMGGSKGWGKGGKGASTTDGHPQYGAAPPCNEHLWNLLMGGSKGWGKGGKGESTTDGHPQHGAAPPAAAPAAPPAAGSAAPAAAPAAPCNGHPWMDGSKGWGKGGKGESRW